MTTVKSYTGSLRGLAQWFQAGEDANAPEDEALREEAYADILNFTAFAVHGNVVVLRTPRGRATAEASRVRGCDIVSFVWVERDRWRRLDFWFNKSSVRSLSARLRANPEKRVADFNELFVKE